MSDLYQLFRLPGYMRWLCQQVQAGTVERFSICYGDGKISILVTEKGGEPIIYAKVPHYRLGSDNG